jgi:hypothetical protein
MPLGGGLLIDPEPGDHLVAPPRQASLARSPLIPQPSSQLMRSSRIAPVIEHSRNRSMASRSNRAVNCEPGSAPGTPWVAHDTGRARARTDAGG